MILSGIIVVVRLPPRIAIMTSGLPTVPPLIKVLGGTDLATIRTWMVCTSVASPAQAEWHGWHGNHMCLSRGPRWRFVLRASKTKYQPALSVLLRSNGHLFCHSYYEARVISSLFLVDRLVLSRTFTVQTTQYLWFSGAFALVLGFGGLHTTFTSLYRKII